MAERIGYIGTKAGNGGTRFVPAKFRNRWIALNGVIRKGVLNNSVLGQFPPNLPMALSQAERYAKQKSLESSPPVAALEPVQTQAELEAPPTIGTEEAAAPAAAVSSGRRRRKAS